MRFKHTDLAVENDLPKLVRDNIPDIIQKNTGVQPHISLAKDDKIFLELLLKKLVEEATEAQSTAQKDELIYELADIQEVIYSITTLLKINEKEIKKAMQIKKERNGGFKKRYILKKRS